MDSAVPKPFAGGINLRRITLIVVVSAWLLTVGPVAVQATEPDDGNWVEVDGAEPTTEDVPSGESSDATLALPEADAGQEVGVDSDLATRSALPVVPSGAGSATRAAAAESTLTESGMSFAVSAASRWLAKRAVGYAVPGAGELLMLYDVSNALRISEEDISRMQRDAGQLSASWTELTEKIEGGDDDWDDGVSVPEKEAVTPSVEPQPEISFPEIDEFPGFQLDDPNSAPLVPGIYEPDSSVEPSSPPGWDIPAEPLDPDTGPGDREDVDVPLAPDAEPCRPPLDCQPQASTDPNDPDDSEKEGEEKSTDDSDGSEGESKPSSETGELSKEVREAADALDFEIEALMREETVARQEGRLEEADAVASRRQQLTTQKEDLLDGKTTVRPTGFSMLPSDDELDGRLDDLASKAWGDAVRQEATIRTALAALEPLKEDERQETLEIWVYVIELHGGLGIGSTRGDELLEALGNGDISAFSSEERRILVEQLAGIDWSTGPIAKADDAESVKEISDDSAASVFSRDTTKLALSVVKGTGNYDRLELIEKAVLTDDLSGLTMQERELLDAAISQQNMLELDPKFGFLGNDTDGKPH